jgi:hypothetical protein
MAKAMRRFPGGLNMRTLCLAFVPLLASASATAAPSDPLQPHMSILGVTVAKSTPSQAQAVLGRSERRIIGSDSEGAKAQCYEGSDGTVLLLVSNTVLSGDEVAFYQLLTDVALATGVGGGPLPARELPRCAPHKTLSRSTRNGGGLHLGMTVDQVKKRMGSAGVVRGNAIVFSSERKLPLALTNEDGGSDPYFLSRSVRVEFLEGRAVAIRVYETTST